MSYPVPSPDGDTLAALHALYVGEGGGTPASRYGRDADDCAWYAMAAAYIFADANGDDVADADLADSLMSQAVNDSDGLASLIAEHFYAIPETIADRLDVSILPRSEESGDDRPEVGCLLDGHRGWRIIADAVGIAVEYGYCLTFADRRALETFYAGDDVTFSTSDGDEHDAVEWVSYLEDSATAWLNEQVARDGAAFYWHDGEYFYGDEDGDDSEDDRVMRAFLAHAIRAETHALTAETYHQLALADDLGEEITSLADYARDCHYWQARERLTSEYVAERVLAGRWPDPYRHPRLAALVADTTLAALAEMFADAADLPTM